MSIPLDTFAAGAPRCRLGFNAEYVERHGVQLLGSYRAYNPVLMRFQNPDNQSPFARGGLNAYAYCHGDPVNLADPTGHFALALQTRRYLWLAAAIGFATAAIAGIGAAGMKKSKSRDAAFAIAGIGLTVGIAAAMPLVFQKFQRTNFRGLGGGLLQRMRHQRNETPAGLSPIGRPTLPDLPDTPNVIGPNVSPTPRPLPGGTTSGHRIASLAGPDDLPAYLYATDEEFRRRFHEDDPPPPYSQIILEDLPPPYSRGIRDTSL